MTGTVYHIKGQTIAVKTTDGKVYQCLLKGNLRLQDITSTHPVVVGDRVSFKVVEAHGEVEGSISHIYPRRNALVRKSVKLSKQQHIIAANIDQMFLLVTLDNPLTSTVFIDRVLATAEAYSIKPILIFNKADTFTEEGFKKVEQLIQLYQRVGYPCVKISAVNCENIEEVKTLMHDKTSVFAGHSGTGKTTLANALDPRLNLKTQDISTSHRQGQHTTTHAEMYDLSFGAKLIDTPGIRGFGMIDMDDEELGDYFPEFFELKSSCRFSNCLHVNEPGCAVLKGIQKGRVANSRYKSYVQILEGDDKAYRY